MINLDEFFKLQKTKQQRVNFEMTYVDMTGDLIAGLLLSQIIYWYIPTKNGTEKTKVSYKGRPAIAKSRKDWYNEIRISPKQYDKAINILINLEIVTVENSMFNAKKTPFIMLNGDIFLNLYAINLDNSSVLPKGQHRSYLKVNTDVDEKITHSAKNIYNNVEKSNETVKKNLYDTRNTVDVLILNIHQKNQNNYANIADFIDQMQKHNFSNKDIIILEMAYEIFVKYTNYNHCLLNDFQIENLKYGLRFLNENYDDLDELKNIITFYFESEEKDGYHRFQNLFDIKNLILLIRKKFEKKWMQLQ